MKMRRSLVLFTVVAVVALIAVALMPASQQASAWHKAHTASTQSITVAVHHKAHAAPKGVHQVAVTVHHKAHAAPKGVHQVAVTVHHKAHAVPIVDPQAHNNPDKVLQNATAMKAQLKGPYGENDVIGGMMSGGY